jgi:hypothetical protein
MLFLVLVFLLGWGLESCGGWYIKFSTPDVPPAPCPIQDLLLEASNFPGKEWEETGSRSEKAAPDRMGIERIGTSFSGPIGGVFQEVYRFESERQASRAYADSAESWFTPASQRTEWTIPQEIDHLAVNADRYRTGCNYRKLGGLEYCQYVAQYRTYVIRFFAGMRALSYKDFIELVNEVNHRATSCLGQ